MNPENYTADDALDDFYRVEPFPGSVIRQKGSEADQAWNRLENWLLSLPVPVGQPACKHCIFHYAPDNTCRNAEMANADEPKSEPLRCGLRIPFKANIGKLEVVDG